MSKEFKMDHDLYMGAVKLNSQWRFFYDEREMWILDHRTHKSDQIPDDEYISERQRLEVVDKPDAIEYCKTFDLELIDTDIASIVDKSQLRYVVNFDEKVFVDSGSSDGFNSISKYVPVGWKSIEDDPYFYVPTTVRELWVNKHVRQDHNYEAKIGIYDYTYIGAVKFASEWHFYYEMFGMWILDFESYVTKFRPNYFTDSIYGDWRKDQLRKVDENQAEEFCKSLSKHELLYDEINILIFNKLDSHKQGKKPKLRYVINFDERLMVDGAYSNVALNLDPIKKYVPSHWTCHADNPHDYILPELNALWKKT